jgi:hypothetical protein
MVSSVFAVLNFVDTQDRPVRVEPAPCARSVLDAAIRFDPAANVYHLMFFVVAPHCSNTFSQGSWISRADVSPDELADFLHRQPWQLQLVRGHSCVKAHVPKAAYMRDRDSQTFALLPLPHALSFLLSPSKITSSAPRAARSTTTCAFVGSLILLG